MTDLRLRPATSLDVAALKDLHASSLRGVAAAYYTPDQVEAFIRHARDQVAGWLRAIRLWVALDGDDVIASAGWLPATPGVADIRSVFVRAGWTRRGVAARLLDKVEAEAAAAGARRFELHAMHGSEAFYVARGYAPGTAAMFDFDGVPFPGRAMSKPAA